MKKLYTLILSAFLFSAVSAQQILLLTETFETGTNSITMGGGPAANTGNNRWTINNQYNGQPTYPNTPPQDSIVSGTINAAPFSNYLHITDTTTAMSGGVSNASWDANNTSDRFCYIGDAFCTLGMTDVTFTFFWICEGDANAYGEVYYRVNGGAWVQTGQTQYRNQSKWKYEVIQNAAFNNVENLQLGFRWVNQTGGTSNVSFGIDDIIAVGNYNTSGSNAVSVTVNYINPNPVCQDNLLVIGYHLSKPLCDGTYSIEMSDATGNFASPYNGGVFNVFAPDTSGFIAFTVPDNVVGACFRIRVNRVSPLPLITGVASACFTINDCPETINTTSAPVMNDADTTCLLSVIDVKFNSYGVYRAGNIYYAELSDSTGSFANPTVLGNLPSRESYPSTPGNVSGLIPASVPPGCGYYIRVRATNPGIVGSIIGPFCLTKCDELTNNHTDIHFCVASGPFPQCSTIVIHPNQWTPDASYDTCNNWTVELRDMNSFGLLNSGGLGVYHDSIGGNFNFCVPASANLLPVAPGMYYMRIVSNCSNQTWNQTGSVIRITIGAPDQNPPVITTDDTVYCNDLLVNLFVNPFKHPPSDYEWSSNLLMNGNAFIWPYNPLIVNLAPFPPQPGDYIFYVREINFGCYGPSSDPATITLITTPSVSITGPVQVCLGDTVTFNVGYLKETYYDWDAPGGVRIFDESNSETTIIFDSIGTYTLSNFSLNDCGSGRDSFDVKVVTLYNVNAGADQTICAGDSITLHGTSSDIHKVFTTQDSATQGRQGAMFNIIAHGDVVIDSFAAMFSTAQPAKIEIYGKQGSYRTFEQNQFAWNQLGGYYNFPVNGVNQMTVIPVEVNQPIAANDTFAFYITTPAVPPIANLAYSAGSGVQQETVYKSDGIIDFVQGTANNYPFGAFIGPRVLNCRIYYSTKQGLHYLWNTGDTTATLILSPTQTGEFSLVVYDTSGCRNFDTVSVQVNQLPVVNAGADTIICKNIDYTMSASSSANDVTWQPPIGLNDYNIINPVFNYTDSVLYILTATNNGCSRADSVLIRVQGPTINAGNDTTLCPDKTYQITTVASDSNIVWSPITGLSNPNSANPVFSNPTGVNYIVAVTDNHGCVAYDTLSISVAPCESFVSVPQAFTPNGDGTNDHFTVYGRNITAYEIRIFNRWGELVYNSTDVNELATDNTQTNRGWDGTYKGEPQSTGTFVYHIAATDALGEKIEKKGNLTLIR